MQNPRAPVRLPYGTCIDAREDKRGLWIKAELPRDDEFVSGRLVPQIKRRGLRGMSIGYRTIESEKRQSDGARLLKQIRLYECSFVSMPMNPQASVETIKNLSPTELANELGQMQLTLNALKDELQPDRARVIREAAHTIQSFCDEVKRNFQVRQTELRDPYDRAESALRQVIARIARMHKATRS
jgi:hypothetical protein